MKKQEKPKTKDEDRFLKEEIEEDLKPKGFKKFWYGLGFLIKTIVFSFFTASLTLLLVFVVMAFSVYLSYSRSFASAKVRDNSTQTIFYDKAGSVIYESYGAGKPDPVSLNDIPAVLKNATLASEDADFYTHGAIDFRGIGRSVVLNVQTSEKPGVLKLTDVFNEKATLPAGGAL
jgi:membrane peptidoglycan carboxypeptidase